MDASKIPNSLEKPDVFASEATKRGAVWTKAMCDWVIATAHSNNDKAEIKKHAVVYIVGAIVLFAASALLGIVKPFLTLRMGL